MPSCRSCGKRITWLKTAGGKAIPVDEDPTENGNIVIDVERCQLVARVFKDAEAAKAAGAEEPRYISHFVTCPDAPEWRRRG
jgi:hypothetical protein